MSYFGSGNPQNGSGRGPGGANQQATILTGPQLFAVNSSQHQIQFQTPGGGTNFFPSGAEQGQSQIQLSSGGTPLALLHQPPGVNFVTDSLGIGQLITNAAAAGNMLNVLMDGQNPGHGQSKQRVFTGIVTKVHDNFGFIDEEVFFQMGVVKSPVLPKEGDRVLVEADFNPSMPFKWNATRVQIVHMGGSSGPPPGAYSSSSLQKSIPPPPSLSSGAQRGLPQGYGSSASRLAVESLPTRRVINNDVSPSPSSLPSLMSTLDSGSSRRGSSRDRDRERKDRERDRERERERERERRDRSRSRERKKARRSRSKSRDRGERERNRRERHRQRSRSRSRDRVERIPRERERGDRRPSRDRSPPKPLMSTRVKRSRSRETIQSSEGRERQRSASPSSRRVKSAISAGGEKSRARYVVNPPRFSLDTLELNASELSLRYKNLCIPSDFYLCRSTWMEAFPLERPFNFLGPSTLLHIFGRRVERLEIPEQELEARKFAEIPSTIEAPDSSRSFSVKVMLLSVPTMESVFRKSGFVLSSEEKEESSFQSLQRIINFMVGVKNGKHEIMALGGPWSPSLDGPEPQSNPKTLIATALRHAKAYASLDLSSVKTWFRFMEVYYRRSNGNLESVVYLLPDLSTLSPSDDSWAETTRQYRLALYGDKRPSPAQSPTPEVLEIVDSTPTPPPATPVPERQIASTGTTTIVLDDNWEEGASRVDVAAVAVAVVAPPPPSSSVGVKEVAVNGEVEVLEEPVPIVTDLAEEEKDKSFDIYDDIVEDKDKVKEEAKVDEVSKVDEGTEADEKEDKGTHFSVLNAKALNVAKLREELSARGLDTKGLKAQLLSRLQEALDEEKAKATEIKPEPAEVIDTSSAPIKSEAEDPVTTEPMAVDPLIVKVETVPTPSAEVKAELEASSQDMNMSMDEALVRVVDPAKILDNGESEMEEGEEKDKEPEPVPNLPAKEAEPVKKGPVVKPVSGDASRYPLIKPGMSVEDRKVWERRYALPLSPRILAFPGACTKKYPNFDCSLMPLSSLREYRQLDKREESFELSLFAEFFFEMLQRDFGFKIYLQLVKAAKKFKEIEESSTPSDSTPASASAPATKKRKTSIDDTPLAPAEKTKTIDPLLLLAFTFFDENQTGGISDEHLEDVLTSLGLQLTIHQAAKLIRQSGIKGGMFGYRKLTDKSEAELAAEEEAEKEESLLASMDEAQSDAALISEVSKGNKNLLPIFTYTESVYNLGEADGKNERKVAQNGPLSLLPMTNDEEAEAPVIVTLDGGLLDVRKMKKELERMEKERLAAVADANAFKNSLTEARNEAAEWKMSTEVCQEELKKTKKAMSKIVKDEKNNRDDLDLLKRATERFVDKIKDVVKLPTKDKKQSSISTSTAELESAPEKTPKSGEKEKE